MKAPVDLSVIQQDVESKWAMALESSVRELTEIRRTFAFGMYNVLRSMIDAPRATRTLISPTPMAEMEDPPIPFTDRGVVGQRVRKAERSGEIWMVAPESTMKGKSSRDI
jgi:hypothetical protein